MSEAPGPAPRPSPPRQWREFVAGWLTWFGVGRLITGALSVVIVVGGGWWLLRAPTPAIEASLPFATASSGPVVVTAAPHAGEPTTSDQVVVVVHVAGAVRTPGVYELPSSARVHEAIGRADGESDDADLDNLNLAARVADGQRIYVPRVGEVVTIIDGGAMSDDGSVPRGPVDLNRASQSEFELLPGVGPSTAAAIVDDRSINGPFASVDDLDRVAGIGPAKLDALRDLVTV